MKAHLQVIFTLDELAAYLKVGKRTLYRLAAHGEIPAFKVGGTWRVPQNENDQWDKEQTPGAAKKEGMRKRETVSYKQLPAHQTGRKILCRPLL
ncbi:helix-turn-helix domain-containing protein [Klebsiella pneumoniae]|uniref:helix-turn-helix domain-containing protein n=1 Tax=Klebsiella pneumoniae TaxID=573 RepID=UPI001939A90E|nr:helix-turn-helix domain-containing protein [Klebsiella pneumoniae]MBM1101613.1 helix-turn-helix domain-containing protein [Klebsiella pneumoniae]